MSKLKFKIGDRVAIKDNVNLYGGDIGTVVNIIPPGFKKGDGSTCTTTTYLVETTDGCCDEFFGYEMDFYHAANEKLSVEDMAFEIERIKEADEEETRNNLTAALRETQYEDVDWDNFRLKAVKEWDKFLKQK